MEERSKSGRKSWVKICIWLCPPPFLGNKAFEVLGYGLGKFIGSKTGKKGEDHQAEKAGSMWLPGATYLADVGRG